MSSKHHHFDGGLIPWTGLFFYMISSRTHTRIKQCGCCSIYVVICGLVCANVAAQVCAGMYHCVWWSVGFQLQEQLKQPAQHAPIHLEIHLFTQIHACHAVICPMCAGNVSYMLGAKNCKICSLVYLWKYLPFGGLSPKSFEQLPISMIFGM